MVFCAYSICVVEIATEFLEILAEPTWDQLEELMLDVEINSETDALRIWAALPELLPFFTCPQLKYLAIVVHLRPRDVVPSYSQNWDLTLLENTLVSYLGSPKVIFADYLSSGYNRLSDLMKRLLPRLAEQNRLDFPITPISERHSKLRSSFVSELRY